MITSMSTVKDVLQEYPASILVFERYGMDYCCGGKKSLELACRKKNIDLGTVMAEIESSRSDSALQKNRAHTWSAEFLANYICENHHAYLRNIIPSLQQRLEKVAMRHGQAEPYLFEVKDKFNAFAEELTSHMFQEEEVLFPYVKRLSRASASGQTLPPPTFGSIQSYIEQFETEHDEAGRALESLELLTNSFTPPPGACNTYKSSFESLRELRDDMHQHIHLENNILFGKSRNLEAAVVSRSA